MARTCPSLRHLTTLLLVAALPLAPAVLDSGFEDEPASWHASDAAPKWQSAADGSWTDRLGLRFRDDCQEDVGLHGLAVWIWSWVTRGGQQRSGHCESKEMRCAAGSKLTALQVRYGRIEKSDRDLYDFRPRCGFSWAPWLGMKFPAEHEADRTEEEGAICSGGQSVTGIQVMRGRNEWLDQDYFNFRLRCGKSWLEQPLGLGFDGLRETRSATCPSGSAIAGLRVHRGFQDWGDFDTYEFQLYCTDGGTRRGGGATRGGGNGNNGAERSGSSSGRKRDGGASGGGGGKSGKAGSSQQRQQQQQQPPSRGPSAFGSRAAEAEAAAAEVRAELARARASKDEL